jgi:hypothetical protein
MTIYIPNVTQEGRILSLLKERGGQGVMVYEMMMPRPQGLGIAQYNARIFGLRKKGYIIQNKEPGHFVLIEPGQQPLI